MRGGKRAEPIGRLLICRCVQEEGVMVIEKGRTLTQQEGVAFGDVRLSIICNRCIERILVTGKFDFKVVSIWKSNCKRIIQHPS